MDLHDSLNARRKRPRLDPLLANLDVSSVPSRRDLTFVMARASQSAPEPQVMSWLSRGSTFQLQVVYRGGVATWRLSRIDNYHSTLVWTLASENPEQIYREILKAVSQPGEMSGAQPEATAAAGDEPVTSPAGTDLDHQSAFLNRYEMGDLIAKGGMGRVVQAFDRTNQCTVAVKFMNENLKVDETTRIRFQQEMQACINFRHPNVVSVYDYGSSPEGVMYMVMEFLNGPSLDRHLTTVGTLTVAQFIRVFSQICSALSQAHEKQIIHRDVKPQNIILTKLDDDEYLAKLVDFGTAKVLGDDMQRVTDAGTAIGTPFYMSPEQCMSQETDCRCDIYSLGCVMYEAISGVRPFNGQTAVYTIMMHVNQRAAPLSAIRSDLKLPEKLDRMILKALEKNPDHRYQTAKELLGALTEFAREESVQPGAPLPTRSMPVPAVFRLLKAAGQIDIKSGDAALILKRWHGGDEGRYLVELGSIKPDLYIAAAHCLSFVESNKMSPDQAILTVRNCGSGMTLEDALAQLR